MRRRTFSHFGTCCSASGDEISYTYDALGARKSKTVNGQTTLYLTARVFGMSHVLMELKPDLNVKTSYVYGGHQQLIEEPVAADRSKDLYLLHDGTVGNITHATTRTGATANSYTYEPFGARTPQTAATASRYGYTGEEYDAETGLVYLRARYYDPTLGRFISPDPFLGRLAEPITQNRYVYVKNNPLGLTDPSGLWSLTFEYYFLVVGGSVTFGENPNGGGGFLTLQGGIGLGGGVVYDPNGASPAYNAANKQSYVAVGAVGAAGANAGILGVNYEVKGGARYDDGGFSGYSASPNSGYGSGAGVVDAKLGFRLSGSIGIQGTWCNVPR